MANNCDFANQKTENMGFCPNEGVAAGVKVKSWDIPMAQLATVTKPTVGADTGYAERLTIPPTGLIPVTGKGFKRVDLLINENELKSTLVGNVGNKKPQASLDCMIANFTARNLGYVDANKNTPICKVIEDSTGQKWVLLDAFMDKADATTGKTYTDNSGIAITITANSALYAYDGEIVELADPTP